MYQATEIATWLLATNYIDCNLNEEVDRITNLKLQKLLYYAQGTHMALYDNSLFENSIEAWKHGPVVRDVYNKYSVNGSNAIMFCPTKESRRIIAEIEKDKKAYKVLRFIYDEFGQYTAWALRNMTHEERPWKETRLDHQIDNDLIKEYFKQEVIGN